MRALHTAATGMTAQELNVQVISNNIANMRTTGYKRQQAHFQDLLYQDMRRSGSVTSQQDTRVPAGIEIGTGVKSVSTARRHVPGRDLAHGEGLRRRHSRRGLLPHRDAGWPHRLLPRRRLRAECRRRTRNQGWVPRPQPGIQVPQDARSVSISAEGQVQVQVAGANEPQDVGQIGLSRFRQQGRPAVDRRQSVP